jgi:hypothetical protein
MNKEDIKHGVKLVAGGIAAAILVASPLVDNGVTASEWLAIAGAFLSGTGLTAVVPSKNRV